MTLHKQLLKSKEHFLYREDGGMTILGLYFFLFMAIFGAFAVDGMNISASQVHLQKAADQAAHAALYNMSYMGNDPAKADLAKEKAIEVVSATLPPARFGTSIEISDITFGQFDHATRAFTPDPTSTSAVMAETSFSRGRLNALNTFLFKLIGFDSFDITRRAVYETYQPGCLREGFLGEDIVAVNSNNNFANGFCIHSNTHVSLNNNNQFEAGTIVSMADLGTLDLPASGFTTNDGLKAALREGTMNLRILNRIEHMIALYSDPDANVPGDTPRLPHYIVDKAAKPEKLLPKANKLETADLEEGKVYLVSCKNKNVTIDANTTMRKVVIISDCDMTFGNGINGSSFEDVMILTSSTSSTSISAPAALRVGAMDNCKDGGGAVIASLGGMKFASGIEMYGSQFLAKGPIEFTSNAVGEGSSLISGQTIYGTSNMDMKLCGNGTGDSLEMDYFRLVF